MSLLRYSARRRHTQCAGNADSEDGTEKLDPISLEPLHGYVVKLGNVCYEPAQLSKSLRRYKRDPVTNEYVRLDVRDRIHGFAGGAPEDADVLSVTRAICIRMGDIREELGLVDSAIEQAVSMFGEQLFRYVAEHVLEQPAPPLEVVRRFFAFEIEILAKNRRALRAMLAFRSAGATAAELRAFGRDVLTLKYEAHKATIAAMRVGAALKFKDEVDRLDIQHRLKDSEKFIEDIEHFGYV